MKPSPVIPPNTAFASSLEPILAVTLILALLVALVFALHAGRFVFRIQPEHSRKLVHVIMGLVAAVFPWVFTDLWPVVLLSVIATLVMAALRWIPTLRRASERALLGIKRRSFGELFFPAAIAPTFWLSDGQPTIYVGAVLCLAVADPAASFVGGRYGRHSFRLSVASKSLEGSGAFFVVAFAVVCSVSAANGSGSTWAVTTALLTAIVTTLVEALSSHGIDNLAIPLTAAATIWLCGSGHWFEVELATSGVAAIIAFRIQDTGLQEVVRTENRRPDTSNSNPPP